MCIPNHVCSFLHIERRGSGLYTVIHRLYTCIHGLISKPQKSADLDGRRSILCLVPYCVHSKPRNVWIAYIERDRECSIERIQDPPPNPHLVIISYTYIIVIKPPEK